MIKHIVMWSLKDEHEGMSKNDIAEKIKKDLENLPHTIREIHKIEVGINEKEAPAACDVSLYSVFASWDDLAAYQQHPDHQKVVDFVKQVVVDRHVVDYEGF